MFCTRHLLAKLGSARLVFEARFKPAVAMTRILELANAVEAEKGRISNRPNQPHDARRRRQR
jgi:hypothetical protein